MLIKINSLFTLQNVHEEHGKSSSNRGGFKMVRNLMIPEHVMGNVIGKGRENLNTIETKAGVSLKVIDNKLHIKGATEKQHKLAVREIKALAVGLVIIARNWGHDESYVCHSSAITP